MKKIKTFSIAITMFFSLQMIAQEKSKDSIKNIYVTRRDCVPSISENNFPLLILNGKIITQKEMETIDTNKIEKINIIKSEAAVALYGVQGKNGVIYITTKENQPKKKQIKQNYKELNVEK